jgi:hypothetical protein
VRRRRVSRPQARKAERPEGRQEKPVRPEGEAIRPAVHRPHRLVGSGKSQAIRALEDLGYFCVDNLPTMLIPTLARLSLRAGGDIQKVAIVVDVREGGPAVVLSEDFPAAAEAAAPQPGPDFPGSQPQRAGAAFQRDAAVRIRWRPTGRSARVFATSGRG